MTQISDTAVTAYTASAIRSLRDEAGFTRSELATVSGVPTGTIRDAEQGRVAPKLATLYRIARACGASVFDLLPSMAEAEDAKG